jgi:hypothetical protein
VWLLALQGNSRRPGGSLLIPQLTRAVVPTRQRANAAGAEMGETAHDSTGDGEVDTDVCRSSAAVPRLSRPCRHLPLLTICSH